MSKPGQTARILLEDGRPEVSYWLGREFLGSGIATWAPGEYLRAADQD